MEEDSNIQEDGIKIKRPAGTSDTKKAENVTPEGEKISAEEKKIDESLDESFPASDPPAHHNFN